MKEAIRAVHQLHGFDMPYKKEIDLKHVEFGCIFFLDTHLKFKVVRFTGCFKKKFFLIHILKKLILHYRSSTNG